MIDPEKLLKEAGDVDLIVAAEFRRGPRNLAALLAFVSFVVIQWENWSRWTLILPSVIGLYALLRHLDIILINRELRQRKSAQ